MTNPIIVGIHVLKMMTFLKGVSSSEIVMTYSVDWTSLSLLELLPDLFPELFKLRQKQVRVNSEAVMNCAVSQTTNVH